MWARKWCGPHLRAGAALLCFMLCAAAAAQSSQPTGGIFETQAIRRDAGDPTIAHQGGASGSVMPNPFDLRRVFFALTTVLLLIFALRWVVKRYFPTVAGGTSGLVRVLSRSPLTAKHQVLLVQVGKRVLVLADNGTQVSALSEITDADEAASLIGQALPRAAVKESFDASLDQAEQHYEEKSAIDVTPLTNETQAADEAHAVGLKSGEIDGLMEKVRSLAKQLGR
jgi:flagellar biogenesis protein FliO